MKMMSIVFVLISVVSSVQAGAFGGSSKPISYNSFNECHVAVIAEARQRKLLISTDEGMMACSKYIKTAYDRCEAFRASDGKWAQMFACRKDLKENEVVLQDNGNVVDLNEYMGWTN
jgi:hypothetical protein